MRLIFRLIKLLLVLLVLSLTLAGLVLFTETGLKQALALAPRLLPLELDYRELSGSLRGELVVEDLHLRAGELELQLARLRFDWRPGELLSRRLHVRQLLLEGVALRLPPGQAPPEEPAEPLTLPDISLPLALDLDEIRLRDVRILLPDAAEPLLIEHALLVARTDEQGLLHLETLSAEAPQGRLTLTGELNPVGDYPLVLNLDWALQLSPYGELRGSGKLSGALGDTLTLGHRLDGFARAQLDASISQALAEPRWELELLASIDDLGLFSPELAGSPLQAELSSRGDLAAFSLQAALDSEVAQLGPVTARLDLSGSPTLLRLHELLLSARDSPLNLNASADIDLERQTVAAQGEWQQLAWPPTGPAEFASPEGRFQLDGSLQDYRAELDALISGVLLSELDIRIRARGNEQQLWLETLSLRERGDSPLSLDASGELTLAELEFSAQGQWRDLRWPLRGEPEYHSESGSFSTSGKLSDYRFLLEASVDGAAIPQGDWRLEGQGSTDALHRLEIVGQTLDGELAGTVSAAWTPVIEWQVELHGRQLNPAVQWPELPGRLGFVLRSDGLLVDGRPDVSVQLSELAGELAGLPIEGETRLSVAGEDLILETLSLRAAQARLAASGTLTDNWAMDWQLTIPDLRGLLPEAAGQVRASGRIEGSRIQPLASLDLELAEFDLTDNRIERLTGNARVDLSGGSTSRLELRGQDLHLGGQDWSLLRIDGSGTPEAHQLQLRIDGDPGEFELALAGGLGAERWDGQLTRLQARATPAGDWQLAQPSPLRAGPGQANLAPTCLHSPPSRLCLQADWSGAEGVALQLELSEFTFDRFRDLLPEGTTIDTALSGQLQASMDPAGRPSGQLQLVLRPGSINLLSQGNPVELSLGSSQLNATLDNDRIQSDLRLDLGRLGQITLDLALAELFAQPSLDGRLRMQADQFDIVSELVPQLQQIEGRLEADLRLSGPLTSADVQGQMRFSDGAVTLPDTGTRITAIQLTIDGPEPGTLRFVGSARSEPGELRLDGNYRLGDQQLTLTVSGQDFEALDTFSRVLISPDLELIVTTDSVELVGEVTIPMADIRPPPGQAGRVTSSPDVVIIRYGDQAPPPPPVTRQVNARLRVILGDQVWIETPGFSGQLRGSLLIEQAPQLAPRASGTVEVVAGDYTIFGQSLAIERGRLLFSGGPVDNPGLDLRVTRRFDRDEVVVGAQVTGSLRQPELNLFSTPTMANSSLVSYLVFGRGPGGSAAENALLLQAASALGARGGGFLTRDIADALGLDVRFTGGATPEDTEVQIGRYLAPNLYVSYGIGLFDALNTFKVRYDLTRNIVLESSTTAVSNSVDLLFRIER